MDYDTTRENIFAHELEEILSKVATSLHEASDEIREYFPQPILDDILNYKLAINLELMETVIYSEDNI